MGQDFNKDKNANDRNESRKPGSDKGGVSQDKARKEGTDRNDRDQKPGAPRK